MTMDSLISPRMKDHAPADHAHDDSKADEATFDGGDVSQPRQSVESSLLLTNHDNSRCQSPQITVTRQSTATPPKENKAFHFVGTNRKRSILDEEIDRLNSSLNAIEDAARNGEKYNNNNNNNNQGASDPGRGSSDDGGAGSAGGGGSEGGGGKVSASNSHGNVVKNKTVKVCVIL